MLLKCKLSEVVEEHTLLLTDESSLMDESESEHCWRGGTSNSESVDGVRLSSPGVEKPSLIQLVDVHSAQ